MTGLDAVVLAGGASRRMGRDKALLELDGQRLVDRAVTRLATVADHVLVASGARSLGRDDEVPDAPDCTGPLAGILAALRRTEADLLAVVPVDAPDIDPRVMARLAALCRTSGRAACVLHADGHVQALHAVIASAARPAVEARVAAGERSPRGLLAWLDARCVDADGWSDLDATGRTIRDWDAPDDVPPGVLDGGDAGA